MCFKSFALFLLLVLKSNGHPLEESKPGYDVKKFLAPRIVGGEEASPGQAKHMVALIWRMEGFSPSLVCGGSIVSPKHVLTAAHCIDAFVMWNKLSPELKGTIGSNYWNYENIIEFSDFKMHEDWDWATIKNDIGLLVSEDIRLNENIAIIPLDFNWVEGPIGGSVFGWGRLGSWDTIPDVAHTLNVTIITPDECLKAKETAEALWGPAPPFHPAIEICTLHSFGHGMCNGDSGSALLDASSRKQVGIVSWGWPCALGFPDFYARVSGFAPFLWPHLEQYYDKTDGPLYLEN